MPETIPPRWRWPRGVDAAMWAYATSDRLAGEEDAYFAGHPLFRVDVAWVLSRLGPEPATVADLGCGGGRAAEALAAAGHTVAAVDLSGPMLRRVAERPGRVLPVRAHLCDLRGLRPGGFDAALLLFSTLGMVRTRAARRGVLAEAARVVRSDGRLLLHAHNLWENLRHPQGRRWLLRNLGGLVTGGDRAGDRPMTYRGIPDLVVHQYRAGELRADLESAGWRVTEVRALHAASAETVAVGRWAALRAGGWLIEAQRP